MKMSSTKSHNFRAAGYYNPLFGQSSYSLPCEYATVAGAMLCVKGDLPPLLNVEFLANHQTFQMGLAVIQASTTIIRLESASMFR